MPHQKGVGIGCAHGGIKRLLPMSRHRLSRIGHAQLSGGQAGGAGLLCQPVKPVAVRIAFKTVYDKQPLAHVVPLNKCDLMADRIQAA